MHLSCLLPHTPLLYQANTIITVSLCALEILKCNAYSCLGYTQAINLMDYSAIVLPVTRADKDVDKFDSSYSPLNDLDAKNWNACKSYLRYQPIYFTKSLVYIDDPEVYDGAPVGLQIVGRKFEEEKIWAIGKIVYEILCKADIT